MKKILEKFDGAEIKSIKIEPSTLGTHNEYGDGTEILIETSKGNLVINGCGCCEVVGIEEEGLK